MDVGTLRIFVDVMRRGSFAAVARDHGVDPSSISRAIASLEDELGLRLFQRTTRRLSPTEAGSIYFDRVEPIIEELEGARLTAVDVGERPTGTLRITAPTSFAELNLVPLLPAFAAAYPELSFDLVLTDASLDLLDERIDVALRLDPLPETGVVASRLTAMKARVCASPDYVARCGHPEVPEKLKDHNCLQLVMPGFTDVWRFHDASGQVTAVPVTGNLRTSNAVALKQCALAGMGIILQARWIVGRELQRGELIDLFPNHDATSAEVEAPAIWLLYPSRSYLPLKVRVFIDFLRRQFDQSSPWDRLTD